MIDLLSRFRRPETIQDADWQAAEARIPCLGHLSAEDRRRLRELAGRFIADKQWNGGGGLVLQPAMQLEIALQACLLVLNLGLEHYRGWVGIIVYPGDFVIPRTVIDEAGVMHEYDDPVLGEAWEGGPVLLSWFDDPMDAGATNPVLHEFAHKLDMGNGEVDGIPELPADMSRREWLAAFGPAYETFCRQVDTADARGEDTALDPYASEHPAEFFAVMSEAFFETPGLLAGEFPSVYEQLKRYYRQDPLGAEQGLVGGQA